MCLWCWNVWFGEFHVICHENKTKDCRILIIKHPHPPLNSPLIYASQKINSSPRFLRKLLCYMLSIPLLCSVCIETFTKAVTTQQTTFFAPLCLQLWIVEILHYRPFREKLSHIIESLLCCKLWSIQASQ